MNQYLLLLHENPADYATLSPAEMQDIIARYSAWAGEMAAKGHLVSGEKLTDDGGKIMRRNDSGVLVSDGPYAVAKDVIGGIFVLKAENEEEAHQLAKACPHLWGSNWIELRNIENLGG